MGIFGKLFSPPSQTAMIDRVIEHMSKQPSNLGTAYKEISYDAVVKYINERKCKIQRQVNKGDFIWYSFVATVNGKDREVWLDKTPEGSGSILTVPPH